MDAEIGDRRTALVRRPGYRLAEGIVTHVPRLEVDLPAARSQWERYVATLAEAGWHTLELPAVDDAPDGVFVEDTLVLYDDLAVVGRPMRDPRRAETPSAANAASALGYEVASLASPATLDGGDALRVGSTVYLGLGGRTNGEALRQLRTILEPRGARVVGVPISGVLHLKTALGVLPDGTLVGYRRLLPADALLPRYREAPEPSGAQLLSVNDRGVIVADDCPRSAELYAHLGFDVVTAAIGEFQKLEGAVTCLSVLAQRFT